jgi:methionyl-tRNA formyltransferase
MNIILLTQNDPFYLSEAIENFLHKINKNENHKIIKAIVSDPSPFGKNSSFLKKTIRLFKIFGFKFFFHYSLKYIFNFFFKKNVLKTLKRNGVSTWHLKKSINSLESENIIRDLKPDIIIIIAGNLIIKKNILEIPKFGIINAHSSLLPKYRGLMPTFWVLRNNEKETGVTVYKLTEGIDDGPIINYSKIKLDNKITHSELIIKSKEIANELLIESLMLIKLGKFKQMNTKKFKYYGVPSFEDTKHFYKIGKSFF